MGLFCNKKPFRIREFDQQDIDNLQKQIAEMIRGLVETTADEKAKEIIDQMMCVTFTEDDPIKMSFDVEFNGGTLLAILGASKLKRELKGKL